MRRHVRPKRLAIIGLAMWIFFVVARTIGHGQAGSAAVILELLSMTWLLSLFLVGVCLVVTDVLTGLGFLFPRFAPALRGWALVQGLRSPVVESYEVQVAGLPPELDGTVLDAMSDMHLGSLLGEDWLNDRIAQVHALRPDMVVLPGDIFEGHGPPQDNLLAGLNRCPLR